MQIHIVKALSLRCTSAHQQGPQTESQTASSGDRRQEKYICVLLHAGDIPGKHNDFAAPLRPESWLDDARRLA
jgi:hypothetical protein